MNTIEQLAGNEAAAAAAAIGLSYNVQIDDKRALVFQTHVPQSVKLGALHLIVDMLAHVGDRQAAIAKRQELVIALDVHVTSLARFQETLEKLDANHAVSWATSDRKGSPKLTASEKQNRDNVEVSIARFREEIGKIKKQIADCDAKINMGAADGAASSTDRHTGLSDS